MIVSFGVDPRRVGQLVPDSRTSDAVGRRRRRRRSTPRPDPDPLPEHLRSSRITAGLASGDSDRRSALAPVPIRPRSIGSGKRWGDCPGPCGVSGRLPCASPRQLSRCWPRSTIEIEADGEGTVRGRTRTATSHGEAAAPPVRPGWAVRTGRVPGNGLVRVGLAGPRPRAGSRRGDQATPGRVPS